MILAVDWALGQHTAIRALTIPQMAQVHGSLNALGFAVCGLLGWRLHAARSDPGSVAVDRTEIHHASHPSLRPRRGRLD